MKKRATIAHDMTNKAAAHKHIDDGIKHVENIDLSMETHQSTHISMEMRL